MDKTALTFREVADRTGERIETVRAAARSFKNGSNGKRSLEYRMETLAVGKVCFVTRKEADRWHNSGARRTQMELPLTS